MKRFLVSVAALIGLAGAAQACPNWSLNPTYGAYNLSLNQLRQGQSLSLTAGGSIDWANCPQIRVGSDDGPGFFERAPDVRFFVNNVEGRRLVFSVRSPLGLRFAFRPCSPYALSALNGRASGDEGPCAHGQFFST